MELELDHLVWGSADVAQDAAWLTKRTGTAPVPGGRHEGLGTANHLLGLQGERRYLELIHRDPQATAGSALAERLSRLETGGLCHWALRCADLDALHERALALGLTSTGALPTSRAAPDGTILRWRLLFLGGHRWGGLVPFFIDWQDTPHPARSLVPAATTSEPVLASPDAGPLRTLLSRLGIDVDVVESEQPAIRVVLSAATGDTNHTTGALPVAAPFGAGLSPLP